MANDPDTYEDIRDAVAKLCAQFPGEYWRTLDREMAYPTEFVAALTQAGWLAALIPEEYCGAGLPLSAGAAILEEIQPKHSNTNDNDLKDKVESGMKNGDVLWISGARVATMKIKEGGVGTKEFVIDANNIIDESKKQGWLIDGESVLANYHRLMEQ